MRLVIYLLGICFVSLGIVLCAQCGLGISPVSSWPFVLAELLPLSFGTLTMLFHAANTLAQALIGRRVDIRLLLQIPLAAIFGIVIDFFHSLISIGNLSLGLRIIFLLLSVVTLAFGMVLMISTKLVQNPPDGTVKLLSEKLGRDMGTVKTGYDIVMCLSSVLFGFIITGRIIGLGAATVVSALCVGRCMTLIRRFIEKPIKSITGTE